MNLIKEKGKHAGTVNRQGMVEGGIRKWKRRVWDPWFYHLKEILCTDMKIHRHQGFIDTKKLLNSKELYAHFHAFLFGVEGTINKSNSNPFPIPLGLAFWCH